MRENFVFSDGLPILSVPRPLTTCVLLAALLLSNVAGWVHIGCCDSDACAVTVANEPVAKACCGHQHCDRSADSTDNSANVPPVPAPEHDSDSCSICQNFYSSRDAVLAIDQSVEWSPVLVERIHVERDDASVEPTFLSGLSVRGPPRA